MIEFQYPEKHRTIIYDYAISYSCITSLAISSTCKHVCASLGGSKEGTKRKKKITNKAEKHLRISEGFYDHSQELQEYRITRNIGGL